MNATLKSKIGCARCPRTELFNVSDARIYGASSLSAVADVLEEAALLRGWEFIAAEVESADGGIEFTAAFHCPACAEQFRNYLAHLPW